MRRQFPLIVAGTLAGAGLLLGAGSGCCLKCGSFKVDHCASFPPGAMPQPLGTYACQWQTAHQSRAEAADFEVYNHEWYRGGVELGRGGQRHIAQLAQRLMTEPRQVHVQPHFDTERNAPDQELNDARVTAVVEALAEHGVENADQLVILAPSQAEPLHGPEGVRLGDMRLQGSRGGFGAGGIGGSMFGGGGMGGMMGGGLGGGY